MCNSLRFAVITFIAMVFWFSQQRGWVGSTSGIWCLVSGYLVPDVSRPRNCLCGRFDCWRRGHYTVSKRREPGTQLRGVISWRTGTSSLQSSDSRFSI